MQLGSLKVSEQPRNGASLPSSHRKRLAQAGCHMGVHQDLMPIG